MSGVVSLDTAPSTSDQSAQVFFVPTTDGASGTDHSSQSPQRTTLGMPSQTRTADISSTDNIGGANSVLLSASDILQSLSLIPNSPGVLSQDSSINHVTTTAVTTPHGGEDTMEITAKSIVILTPKGQGKMSFSNSDVADSQPAKELMVQGIPLHMQPIVATSIPCTTMATLPPGSIIITLPHQVESRNICNILKLPGREKTILGKEKQKRKDRVVCNICSAGFSTRHNLLRHLHLHKPDTQEDSRPTCELCGRKFTQISDLKRHLHTHTGTEPYRCQLCGRGFLRRSDLSTHLRFHNKVKPFQCALCDKTYYQSGDLKRHIRKSHEEPQETACPVCQKMCATERSLRTHLRAQHNNVLMPWRQQTGQVRTAEDRHQTCVTSGQQDGEVVQSSGTAHHSNSPRER